MLPQGHSQRSLRAPRRRRRSTSRLGLLAGALAATVAITIARGQSARLPPVFVELDGDGVEDWASADPGFDLDTGLPTLDEPQPGLVSAVCGVREPSSERFQHLKTLWWVEGMDPGDLFGLNKAWLDDINEDGAPDLLVSAPGHRDGAGHSLGAAFVLSGRDGTRLREHHAPDGEAFALSVWAVPDRDADGLRDYAIFGLYWHPDKRLIATKYIYSAKSGEPIDLFEIAVWAAGLDLARGDANLDGVVDGNDVAATIGAYGRESEGLPQDTTGDWAVNIDDLKLVIENLGRRGGSPAAALTLGADLERWPRESFFRNRYCWVRQVHLETCPECLASGNLEADHD